MAKPICVIYFPETFGDMSGSRNWIYEYMRFLNGERVESNQHLWGSSDYYKDYYWFCFYKFGIGEPEFKVFYEKDFTETQFEELKNIILKSIEKNVNQNQTSGI